MVSNIIYYFRGRKRLQKKLRLVLHPYPLYTFTRCYHRFGSNRKNVMLGNRNLPVGFTPKIKGTGLVFCQFINNKYSVFYRGFRLFFR